MKKHCVVFNDNQEIKRRTSGAYKFAQVLRSHGYSVTVVDWVSSWPEEDLQTYLESVVGDDTVLFAFSYTWMLNWWVTGFVQRLRSQWPGVKIIAGGQQFFQVPVGFDLCLYGYSELAICASVDWLVGDTGVEPRGMIYREDIRAHYIDCNTHYSAQGLRDLEIVYHTDDFVQPEEVLTIELSRGCRFACSYCNYAFLGVKDSVHRDRHSIRSELMENYRRWGVTNYLIADDTLNDSDPKLEELACAVESLPFVPNFGSFIRIDLTAARPQQRLLLSRARVWAQFYGVETFHAAAGKSVGKGMSPQRIQQAMLDMRDHFQQSIGYYRGSLGMIAGLPNEPPLSWRDSQQWLETNWSDQNWEWWPLDISTDENVNTLSKFSRDHAAHGYMQIVDPLRRQVCEQQFLRDRTGLQHKKDINSMMWSSAWADIGDAIDFCNSVRSGDWYKNRRRIANFHILQYFYRYPRDQLLAMRESEHSSHIVNGDQYRTVIRPYIEKKLASVSSLTQFNRIKLNKRFYQQARSNLFYG